MPIVAPALKKKMEARLIAALAREHADEIAQNPKALESHKKMAAAISDIALDICEMLLLEVTVAPSIPVAGACSTGPLAGMTVGPGKLL